MNEITPACQLALLLVARWSVNGVQPLTNSEFMGFRRWLGNGDERAVALMSNAVSLDGCPIDVERLVALLNRGLGVFQSVDRWLQAGLWVRSWSDEGYPSRFRQLRLRAPALLFGYGDPEAFSERALAIVGSRNASDQRLEIATKVGAACAAADVTVVSGGARGVDTCAMRAGIEGGGTVVGVLSDSLLKASGNREYREAIVDHRLCLMSEVHPEAKFDVGTAMARNRLEYACADAALVIECEPGKGGTWNGAMEARREGKNVYVLRGARAEKELLSMGAVVIDTELALRPEALIVRSAGRIDSSPDTDANGWLSRILRDSGCDVEALRLLLATESRSIAEELIAIGKRAQLVAIEPIVEQTVVLEPAAQYEPRKRKPRGSRKLDVPSLFGADEATSAADR